MADFLNQEKHYLGEGIHVEQLRNEDLRQSTLEESKETVAQIDELMSSMEEQMNTQSSEQAEEYAVDLTKLSIIKERQLSYILINETKRRDDSKDMRAVKDRLVDVERMLEMGREKNGDVYPPFTGDDIVAMEETYGRAIEACKNYVSKRTSKSQSPKYIRVSEALKNLLKEQALFTQVRMRINAGELLPEEVSVEKPTDLLFIGSIYEKNTRYARKNMDNRPQPVPAGHQALRACEQKQGAVKDIKKYLRPLFKFITGEADIKSAYKDVSFKDGKQKSSMTELCKAIAKLKTGVYSSASMFFYDEIAQLIQDDNNKLSIIIQGQRFEIPGTTDELRTKLSSALIEDKEHFGEDSIVSTLEAFDISDESTTTIADIRTVHDLSIRVLEKYGNFDKPLFNNLPTQTIRTLAVHLIKGDMDASEIKEFVEVQSQDYEKVAEGRDYDMATLFFMMLDENDQNAIINTYKTKTKNASKTPYDAAISVLTRDEMPATKSNVFRTIMRVCGKNEAQGITSVMGEKLNRLYHISQKDFDGVPNTMLDVMLSEHSDSDHIDIDDVKKLRDVCKDADFKSQMQNNMHDLEIDLLVRRDEMAGKIRVTGLDNIKKQREMEAHRKVVLDKHEEIKEEIEQANLFFKVGKVLGSGAKLNPLSKEVEVEKEKQIDMVQKFMADIFFSKDTWTEDGSELAPGERLKKVLVDNTGAIAYLLKEYATQKSKIKDKNADIPIPLLKETLDRIPMPKQENEDEEDITGVLQEAVSDMIKQIADKKVNINGAVVTIEGLITTLPYASIEAEINKYLKEDNADLTSIFNGLEANINKQVNEKTNLLQDTFNREMGISFDEHGNIVIAETEDKDQVDRPSNKTAIENEKERITYMTALPEDLALFTNMLETPDNFRDLTTDEQKYNKFMELAGRYKSVMHYMPTIDRTKKYEDETERAVAYLRNLQMFLNAGGDYVYTKIASEYYAKNGIDSNTGAQVPPEEYKKELNKDKTMPVSKILNGLYGTSVADHDDLLGTSPMLAARDCARIINQAKLLYESDSSYPGGYDALVNNVNVSFSSFMHILPYKSNPLLNQLEAKVRILIDEALTKDEDNRYKELKDKNKLKEIVELCQETLGDIASLKYDQETVEKLKDSTKEDEIETRNNAEKAFLDKYKEYQKNDAVTKIGLSIDALLEDTFKDGAKVFLQPLFDDTANYGAELKAAYETFLQEASGYNALEAKLTTIPVRKVTEKLQANDQEYLNNIEELRRLEPGFLKAKRDFAAVYNKVIINRVKIRKWLADGGEDPAEGANGAAPAQKPQKLSVEEGRKKLQKMVEDVSKGKEGQGKFVKLVMGQYFKKMSVMDKRAMVASAIRNTKSTAIIGGKVVFDPDEDVNASFISGLLKGAGPLFQKMLQGLPEGTLPKEFKKTLVDMKSNLSHIPEEVVEARLSALVAESRGKITSIEVKKSLGAASVGETFLVKLYGPDYQEGQEAVVKILRPEVKNRMDREKAFMMECAKATSKGMELTYQGKLKNINEELDFTLEAGNIKSGEIYNKAFDSKKQKDDVEAMKLSPLVSPSSNVMLLEKAEGTTLSKYMEETDSIHQNVLEKNATRDAYGTLIYRRDVEKRQDRKVSSEDIMSVEEERKKLIDRMIALKKRKAHLINLSKKWTYEGIFGKGFYHADLHSGNIQVSDDKAVVLDFGNCTSLTEEQKTSVIRMMVSLITGYWETFRDEFIKLMTNTDPQFIESHKKELSDVVEKVFSYGNNDDAALRIMAIISEASRIGFEIPRAINDFADGALRLQNSVDAIDESIKALDTDVKAIDEKFLKENESDKAVDLVANVHNKKGDLNCLQKQKEILKRMVISGIPRETMAEDIDRMNPEDFAKKYFSGISFVSEYIRDYCQKEDTATIKAYLVPIIGPLIQTFDFLDEAVINQYVTRATKIFNAKKDMSAVNKFLDELKSLDVVESDFVAYQKTAKDANKSDEEKAAAKTAFLDKYFNVMTDRYITKDAEAANQIINGQISSVDYVFNSNETVIEVDARAEKRGYDNLKKRMTGFEEQLSAFFKDEQYGGEVRTRFDELANKYKELVPKLRDKQELTQEESDAIDKAKKDLITAINKINSRNLNKILELRILDNKAMMSDNNSFQHAMGETLMSRYVSAMWKMGPTKFVSIGSRVLWDKIFG